MVAYTDAINHHYGHADLSEKILNTLRVAGKNVDQLTRADLSAFDEFHIGGIVETRALAKLADLKPGMQVIDVGSGLGGPARTLTAEFGCRVTGLDLTSEYCRAAEVLTERIGLSDRIAFHCGNALDMPFNDHSFDVVWMQFAGMNIADKAGLYSQAKRVLKRGGRLVFHEVLAGEHRELHFPLFWANDPSINHLRPAGDIRSLLTELGFKEQVWRDVTRHSYDWFRAMIERAKQKGPAPLGFNVFIPDSVPQKAANVLRNLEENRISVVQAVFTVDNAGLPA